VTVQVTDAAGGSGVASIPITVGTPAAPATGGHKQNGAGTHRKSHFPTGPKKSSGHHRGGPAGNPKSGQATTPAKANTNTTSGATTRPSSTGTTPTTTAPAPSRTPTTTSTPHPATAPVPRPKRTTVPRTRPTTHTPVPPAGPRVTGLLISDVTPVPAAVSPLAHTVPAAVATAPTARRAIRASRLPAFGAALAVALLLGLGARRELRTRRDWRALHFGS